MIELAVARRREIVYDTTMRNMIQPLHSEEAPVGDPALVNGANAPSRPAPVVEPDIEDDFDLLDIPYVSPPRKISHTIQVQFVMGERIKPLPYPVDDIPE